MTRRPIRTAFIVLAGLLTAPAVSPAAAPPPSIRSAVVLVAKRNPESGEALPVGTAFHIGEGWFRSAAHVVTFTVPRRYEAKKLEQWSLFEADEAGLPRRLIGPFDVVCVDTRWKGRDDNGVFPHDSALIRLTAGTVPATALRPADRRPAVGEAVSVWGFPEGSVLFESRSTLVELTQDWVLLRNEMGRPTIGGHSGSPVVDRGESVIGILAGGQPGILSLQRAVTIWDAERGCPRPR
jgi:hypothetical protein